MSLEIERRQFVQLGLAAAATLTLPNTVARAATDTAPAVAQVVLHDLAVPHALHLAAALAAGAQVLGIHGDPSSVLDEVQRLRTQAAGRIQITGVTREAAPFCLQGMLGSEAAALSMRRIDGDLFVWTINATRV